MKFSSCLLGAAALVSAFASPLIDLERTSLTLDSSKSALDAGELVLHLQRVDDLLSDDQTLLLERQTHVGLRIQLDAAAGVVDVNGNKLPLIDASAKEQGTVALAVIKAETFSLPPDMPETFYDPEHIQSLVGSMSKGIVGVKVRVESEIVPAEALSQAYDAQEDAIVIQSVVDGVSLRKIGLFIAIDEVEGESLQHSRIIYTPILQLLVSAKVGDAGQEITQVSTLQIGDQPVSPEGIHSADILPDLHHLAPQIDAAERLAVPTPFAHHRKHSSGLLNWLKGIFQQPRYAGAHPVRRPCRGRKQMQKNDEKFLDGSMLRGVRKGHALGHLKSSGLVVDQDGGNSRHASKRECFMGRFRRGVRFAGQYLVEHFHEFYIFHAFAGIVFLGLIFKGIRAMKHSKAEHASNDGLPDYDDLEYYGVGDEKLYAVYVDVPSQEALPVFDAEERDQAVLQAEKV